MSLFNYVLYFILDFNIIVILCLWSLLVITSPAKGLVNKQIKPYVVKLVGEYFRIVERLCSSINGLIKKPSGAFHH